MLHDLIPAALGYPEDPPEFSNVAVVEGSPVFELQADVGMFVGRMLQGPLQPGFLVHLKRRIGAVGEAGRQLSGHSEMDAERDLSQGKKQQLPMPTRLAEGESSQTTHEIADRLPS